MITLPQNAKWNTAQASDLYGYIVRTKNIDFNKEGYVSLAKKAIVLYSKDNDSNFNRPIAITSDGSVYYIVTTDHVFSLTPTYSALTFAEITSTGMPSIQNGSDAIYFNGKLVVSGDTTVYEYSAGTWTSKITGLSATIHPLCASDTRAEFAVGSSNTVKTYDTSYTIVNTCTLPANCIVTSIRCHRGLYYIGTRTKDGSSARLFTWNQLGDGAGAAAPSDSYPSGGHWIYAVEIFKASTVIITSTGQCLRFNGGGFDELFNLPVYYESYEWENSTYSATGVGHVLNRGLLAAGDLLYLNIEDEVNNIGFHRINQPSGLWIYDPKVGLYHKSGFNTETYKTVSISTLASSIFTMASAHGLSTGDAVWASSVSNITGLTAGQVYYADVQSTTAFRLCLSPADALSARFITTSGTPSGDTLSWDEYTMVGNTRNVSCGAVYPISPAGYINPFFASEVLFGGTGKDPDGNSIHALISFGMGRNVGSFVTAWLPTEGITDTLQKVFAKLKPLRLSTDKIVVKYRIIERFGLPTPNYISANGKSTWVDTTSFTIDTTLKDVKSAAVGDEVEIIEGACAGYSGHITAINDNTSTYTYTIDETLAGGVSGDLSDCYIDNWTKLGTITSSTENIDKGFLQQNIDAKGAWIQLKFELRGVNISISMLELINSSLKLHA